MKAFAESHGVPGGRRVSDEVDLFWTNIEHYREVSQMAPSPGAPVTVSMTKQAGIGRGSNRSPL